MNKTQKCIEMMAATNIISQTIFANGHMSAAHWPHDGHSPVANRLLVGGWGKVRVFIVIMMFFRNLCWCFASCTNYPIEGVVKESSVPNEMDVAVTCWKVITWSTIWDVYVIPCHLSGQVIEEKLAQLYFTTDLTKHTILPISNWWWFRISPKKVTF